jgi:magnesium-transporting ATPase (P-type)
VEITIIYVLAHELSIIPRIQLGIAISLEPKEKGLLDQPPASMTERVLSKQTLSRTLFYRATMATIVMIVYFIYRSMYKTKDYAFRHLNSCVMVQNCRSPIKSAFTLGILKNRVLFVVYAIDIILVSILYIFPPLTALFQLVIVAPQEWVFVFVHSSLVFVLEELRKKVSKKLQS